MEAKNPTSDDLRYVRLAVGCQVEAAFTECFSSPFSATFCYDWVMTPKLTNEQREAALQRLGQPVPVEDEQTREIYFLVKEADAPNLIDNWTRLELQKGFDAIDRGDVTEFDAEKIKAEGRKRLEQDPTS